jgi:hypothetical protein
VAGTSASASAGESLPSPLPPLGDPVVRSNVRRHARLLTGVALVDTGTVTLTFVIVPLVLLLPRAVVPDPGGYAELLVLVLAVAVCALMSVWAALQLAGPRAAPRRLFLTDRASLEWRAAGLGLLNAAPSLSAVAVPSIAVAVVAQCAGVRTQRFASDSRWSRSIARPRA